MTGSGDIGGEHAVPARSSLRGVTSELWKVVVDQAYIYNGPWNNALIQAKVDNLRTLEAEQKTATAESYQRLRDMGRSGELEGVTLIEAYEALTEFCDPEGFRKLERKPTELYNDLNRSGVLFAVRDYDDQLLVGRTAEGSDDTPIITPSILNDSTMILRILATQEDGQDPSIISARSAYVTLGKKNIETILAKSLTDVRSMATSDSDRCDRMIEIAMQYAFIAHRKSPDVLAAVAEAVAEVLPDVMYDPDNIEEASRMIRYLLTYAEAALNRIDNDEAWRCVDSKPGDGIITSAMNYLRALLMARNPEFTELSPRDQKKLEFGEWQALCLHGRALNDGDQSDRHLRTNSPFIYPVC